MPHNTYNLTYLIDLWELVAIGLILGGRGAPLHETPETGPIDLIEVAFREAAKPRAVDLVKVLLDKTVEAAAIDLVHVALQGADSVPSTTKP